MRLSGRRLVYAGSPNMRESARRRPGPAKGRAASGSSARKLAPLLRPLVRLCLLPLVFLLGYLSARELEDVSTGVFDLQSRQAAKVNTLLELRAAITKLDNEARARARIGEPEATIQAPLALRLRNARDEVNDRLQRFDHLSLARTGVGAAFAASSWLTWKRPVIGICTSSRASINLQGEESLDKICERPRGRKRRKFARARSCSASPSERSAFLGRRL